MAATFTASHAALTEFALQVCVALAMAIGLERLRIRTGSVIHNVGAVLLTVYAGLATVFGLMLLENPMHLADRCRRRLHQPAPAWLRAAGGAGVAVVLCGGRPPRAAYANTIAAGALVLALTYVTLEIRRLYHGPVLMHGDTTGAEQYTYSIAWLAFGVVLLGDRHPVQFAARPAGIGRGDRADDREGVPDRHVDTDRGLPRAVVHVPGTGAGGDRLAVPAHPVSQAAAIAAPAAYRE